MTDHYTEPLESDWGQVSDYWIARAKKLSEQQRKVDPKMIPDLSQLYRTGDKKRAEEQAKQPPKPYSWEGQGMIFPPGSKFLPEKGDVINGGKKE